MPHAPCPNHNKTYIFLIAKISKELTNYGYGRIQYNILIIISVITQGDAIFLSCRHKFIKFMSKKYLSFEQSIDAPAL